MSTTTPSSAKSATINRLVTPEHVCPYGLKSLDLLHRKGLDVDDRHVETEADATELAADPSESFSPCVETDGTRMCALLVGLPDVVVVGVGEWPGWLRIVITAELEQPSCRGRAAHRHGVREVALVDLAVFGRPARLVWRKQRWCCPMCRRCGLSRTRGSRRRAAG